MIAGKPTAVPQWVALKIALATVDDTTEGGPLYVELTEAARELIAAQAAVGEYVAAHQAERVC